MKKESSMFRLDSKVAVITGASRGIGRAIAESFAKQGAHVVINYVAGEEKAREVLAAVEAAGGKGEISRFDVGDSGATDVALQEIAKRHGKIDILVANAGISVDGLLMRLKDEDIDRLFQINVRGAIACARSVMRPMIRARKGRIIFLSSVVGEMGNAGQTAYAATKAALLGVTKSVAREYASRSITVNAVAPGFIDTDMTAHSAMSSEMKAMMLKLIPLGRTGSAEEVAAACTYLASDEAAYVTGQTLRVNGGMYV